MMGGEGYRRSAKRGIGQDDEAVFVKGPRRINVISSESHINYQTISSENDFEVGRESVSTVTFCSVTAMLQKFYSTSTGAWGDRQERIIVQGRCLNTSSTLTTPSSCHDIRHV